MKRIDPDDQRFQAEKAAIKRFVTRKTPRLKLVQGKGSARTWLTIKPRDSRAISKSEADSLQDIGLLVQPGESSHDISPRQRSAIIRIYLPESRTAAPRPALVDADKRLKSTRSNQRTIARDQTFPVKVKKQAMRIKVGSPGQIAKRLSLRRNDVLEIKPTSEKGTGRIRGTAGKMKLSRTFNADITTTQSVKDVIKSERGRERGFGPLRKAKFT